MKPRRYVRQVPVNMLGAILIAKIEQDTEATAARLGVDRADAFEIVYRALDMIEGGAKRLPQHVCPKCHQVLETTGVLGMSNYCAEHGYTPEPMLVIAVPAATTVHPPIVARPRSGPGDLPEDEVRRLAARPLHTGTDLSHDQRIENAMTVLCAEHVEAWRTKDASRPRDWSTWTLDDVLSNPRAISQLVKDYTKATGQYPFVGGKAPVEPDVMLRVLKESATASEA